jgi:DNA repair protein RecN (Recombination protein N)
VLLSLSIKNFSLIEDLEVSFDSGLSILTGQTGSGKSILLQALSLILGQRADLSTIRANASKCIVEATFDMDKHKLKTIFDQLDLDEERHTLIRRELSATGKSRAFINDTPVTLDALRTVGNALVDIHTQRQTIQLTDPAFYLNLIDAYGDNAKSLAAYKASFKHWHISTAALESLRVRQRQSGEALDYHKFLLNELEPLSLSPEMIATLEEEVQVLKNATGLRSALAEVVSISTQDGLGVQDQMISISQLLDKIANLGAAYQSLYERISSVRIELSDIISETQHLGESVQDDPARLQQVEELLSTLHHLCQKHHVSDAAGLIEKRTHLQQLCEGAEALDEQIETRSKQVALAKTALDAAAKTLSSHRQQACNPLAEALAKRSRDLGMEHVQFSIVLNPLAAPTANGVEEAALLFSANKGIDFAPLNKVASGGELSRIMLVIKSIVAEKSQLPTLILDEIDTGVSGEMAKAMGKRMHEMSRHMQVISITHLPQIAALADAHYKVYKTVVGASTQTFLTPLDEEQRIEELAEMLSGKDVKASARLHARELRNV